METIRFIVRNLIFLVLLAAFLEMLLPLRDARKFVQVILGLFILAVILNPVVTFFQQTPLFNLDFSREARGKGEELRSILAQGETLQQATVEQARGAYVKRLEEQVVVMVRLVPGVGEAKARVELAPSSSLQALGTINKVYVTVKPGQEARGEGIATPVEEIRIGKEVQERDQSSQINRVYSYDKRELLSRVQETIASLFGLRSEQVIVKLEFPG
ncbi:MAG: stage III sporulation protein AF [Bacillota bacterium]|jgi:stage III sporulation protein AF|nr:stage III sporulation protein AF [Bacillota bacterium]